ncbi:unnamed protein product [Oppiella nova]|uniref:Thioesterase domain-containing protein n=1 Tax=Oppiella nova TaxID=334625 RepID=A0A7R9QF99_9ACAR|nr:unnamed protein product [Oppiella nova]CAG2164661.1 unnamed protein product [Oppiella nova]
MTNNCEGRYRGIPHPTEENGGFPTTALPSHALRNVLKRAESPLMLGLVSAVFGTLLPGPGAVVVNQTIHFTKPLHVGEEVCAEVTVIDIRKVFIECKYVCFTSDGKSVMDGTARLVMVS